VVSSGFFQMAQTCPKCRGEGELIQTPCPACHGQGRVRQEHHIRVKIPAGVETGSNLRVRGEGESGSSGKGDLYVVIEVRPHEVFQRHNNDLLVDQAISLSTAVLGGEIHVPTLGGSAAVKIPAGTPGGKIFRLRGKGIADVHGRGIGDELVRVTVEIPTRLSAEQRRLMEEFARASGENVKR
jgi:molecular chaperone DnaJ